MIFLYIVLGIIFAVLIGVIVYLTGRRINEKEISYDEINKLIEDSEFWETVKKCSNGCLESESLLVDNGYIKVLAPCMHHDCPCHITRADCCNSCINVGDKEYCEIYVNINKLCNLPEKPLVKDTNVLTEEEAKELGKLIIDFIGEIKK